jgi:hypothetical protein
MIDAVRRYDLSMSLGNAVLNLVTNTETDLKHELENAILCNTGDYRAAKSQR